MAHHGTTSRADGDFAIDGEPATLAAARRAVAPLPWVWLRQVHGAQVHRVTGDGADVCGREGDALVTSEPAVVLAVQTADCVPVTFSSPEGIIGVAHAGWRGIEAGVLQATVAALRDEGASQIHADLGPCIHASCYEFGDTDLDRLVATLGPHVEARTSVGSRALDTVAAATTILRSLEVGVDADRAAAGPCTACDPDAWYSHRARADAGRLATVIWREAAGEGAS